MGKKQKRVKKNKPEESKLGSNSSEIAEKTSNVPLRNSDSVLIQQTSLEKANSGTGIDLNIQQSQLISSNAVYSTLNSSGKSNQRASSGYGNGTRKRAKSAPQLYEESNALETLDSSLEEIYLQRNANSTNYQKGSYILPQDMNQQFNSFEDFSANDSSDCDNYYLQQKNGKGPQLSSKPNENSADSCYLPHNSFVVDELPFKIILEKIFFEGYSYDDIKDYLYPVLRGIKDSNSFFGILIDAIKDYATEVRDHLLDNLKEVLVKSNTVNTKTQVTRHVLQAYDSYKPFNKNADTYNALISKFYESYGSVERLSEETGKISSMYLKNFTDKTNAINFDCLELHHNIFLSIVYNDPYIKHFLDSMYNLYKENSSYAQKYPIFARSIKQLFEHLYSESDDESYNPRSQEKDSKANADSTKAKAKAKKTAPEEHKTAKKDTEGRVTRQETNKYAEDGNDQPTSQERKQLKKLKKKIRKKNKKNNLDDNTHSEGVISPGAFGTPEKKTKNFIEEEEKVASVPNKENQQTQINQQTNTTSKKNGLDREIEDFERRLLSIENVPAECKVKPNLSENWIKNLKQIYQKKLNAVFQLED